MANRLRGGALYNRSLWPCCDCVGAYFMKISFDAVAQNLVHCIFLATVYRPVVAKRDSRCQLSSLRQIYCAVNIIFYLFDGRKT